MRSWMNYLYGNTRAPERISNRFIYNKYFVYGEKIQLSQDFYFLTEELWKFVYSVYGGGPIMKKVFNGDGSI